MSEVRGKLKLEDVDGKFLVLKNFQGKATDYNREGDRNFGLVLTEELAETLERDGWNIKHFKPDETGYATPWLKVKVKFGKFPPKCVLIKSRGKRPLDEESIEDLDWIRIRKADLIINPYNYPAMGKRPAGVTAYLEAIYVTVEEDELDEKYADIPDLD